MNGMNQSATSAATLSQNLKMKWASVVGALLAGKSISPSMELWLGLHERYLRQPRDTMLTIPTWIIATGETDD